MSNVSEFSSYNASTTPTPPSTGGGGSGSPGSTGWLKEHGVLIFAVAGVLLAAVAFFLWRQSNTGGTITEPQGPPQPLTGGSPVADPPAPSQAPTILGVNDGTVACDPINGCQYFSGGPQPTAAGASVIPTDTQPTTSNTTYYQDTYNQDTFNQQVYNQQQTTSDNHSSVSNVTTNNYQQKAPSVPKTHTAHHTAPAQTSKPVKHGNRYFYGGKIVY